MRMSRWLKAAILAMALVAPLTSAESAAVTDEQRCLSGLAKAKGKFEQCVEKWAAKVYGGKYTASDLQAQQELAKCRIKYAAAWDKLQGLGTTCNVTSRYTDDSLAGTVTDNLTGLVWEKKTTAAGSGTDYGERHDVDNDYTWSTGAPFAENGDAYTDFLANLNTSGFANANGWRLPTFVELQTILLPEPFPCATDPCIASTFGSTASDYYWSSTTVAGSPGYVWNVYFAEGAVDGTISTVGSRVRAVRGGL